MRGILQDVRRLPDELQVLLGVVPVTVAALMYGGLHWLNTDWGRSALAQRKDDGYHLLGAVVVGLGLTAGLFSLTAVVRSLRERSYRSLAFVAIAAIALAFGMILWRGEALARMCACEGGA